MSIANRTPPRCSALVVEDEWLLRLDLAEALEAAGIAVTEAATAEDAMTIVESGAQVDILITDIRLGGVMTGWDLAEAFRTASPAGAVIYASANAALSNRQVADSLFFTKPIPLRALVESCVKLCRYTNRRKGG